MGSGVSAIRAPRSGAQSGPGQAMAGSRQSAIGDDDEVEGDEVDEVPVEAERDARDCGHAPRR